MRNGNENEKEKNDMTPTKRVVAMLRRAYNDLNDGVVTDPNGSYTGVCTPKGEKPVQDVDDL